MSEQLPIRKFGASGPETTALGQGGAVISRSSYADGVATIKGALEAGIRYFDTSPGYCDNESQLVFGEGLEGAGEDIMIATKLGYFRDSADFRRPEALRRQIEDDLRRLRRDRVDVLQVHEANWACWWKDGAGRERIGRAEDYDFAGAPVFDVLHEARAKGLCRYIGITGNVAREMTRVLQDVEVDTFLMAYNYDLILRTAEVEAIPLAKEKDAVLILGAIFYAGRLVEIHPEWLETPPDWMNETLRQRFARLYEIQRESGLGMVELCVRFALAQSDASVVLVGTKTPEETAESVRAAEAGPLPADVQKSIETLGLNMER
jgi:aryl-alcohol dehydrogenase-like predicted oxidoreductase